MFCPGSNVPTILAVDDSDIIQTLVKRALSDNYRVLVADSAVDALALLDREKVSLLLLDVVMPEVDGLEFCRTVRSLPQFCNLPVVMLTSLKSRLDQVQGRMAGATEYLTKPFDADYLRQVVDRFVELDVSANAVSRS